MNRNIRAIVQEWLDVEEEGRLKEGYTKAKKENERFQAAKKAVFVDRRANDSSYRGYEKQ